MKLLCLAAASLTMLACAGRAAAPPTSLLLVTIDTLRADHVGCYGDASAHTPHLDALCAQGVVFESAFAPAPITLASHASMMTGLHPAAHGLYTNASGRLGNEVQTLAEALRPRVRRAAAIVGSVVLNARFGLDQGFDDYDDRMPPAPLGGYLSQRERRAPVVAAAAAAWIRQHAAEPFFLWIHFYDPHAPYDPPPPWSGRLVDPYDGEVAAADEGVGQVLQALGEAGALDKTLIVVAGDHGEDLGQHGEPGHGIFLYDSTLRVPLIFRYPARLPRGRRVAGVVRLVDLMPTVLELFELPGSERAQGRSLGPLLLGTQEDLNLEAFAESRLPELQYGWARLAALRQRRWLYVRAPEEELYDLATDARQGTNVAGRERERAAESRQRLDAVEREVTIAGEPPRVEMTEEMTRQLESLGYVGTPPRQAPASRRGGADPKRRLGALASLNQAGDWVAAGRAAEAAAALRGVLATDPGNPYALRLHARSLAMLGKQEEARAGYEKLLSVAGEDPEVLNSLGAIDLRLGRAGEAERYFRRTLDLVPSDARARNNLAFILAQRGQTAEAVSLLEEVVKNDPLQLDALLNLALLRERMDQADEAERILRRAHEQAAQEPSLAAALADLLVRNGRPQAAVQVLERSLQASPQAGGLKLALAPIYERSGRRSEAEKLYREVLASSASPDAQRQAARAALSRLRNPPPPGRPGG